MVLPESSQLEPPTESKSDPELEGSKCNEQTLSERFRFETDTSSLGVMLLDQVWCAQFRFPVTIFGALRLWPSELNVLVVEGSFHGP